MDPGWIGFVATIAVIVGGFAGGGLADAILAPKRVMKQFLVGSAVPPPTYLSTFFKTPVFPNDAAKRAMAN